MATFDSDKISKIHRELHSHLPSEPALRVKALESVLVDKGLLDTQTVDNWVDIFSNKIGPKRGAQVVAKAWIDPDYKARLLENGSMACAELGFGGQTGKLQAVENTDALHNLVVCTLCSCYPGQLLGVAPAWYKTNEYRARAVREPRGVLKEFGVEVGDDVEVRVWDSTSERRYLVVPQRPTATKGWSEEALAELVTRNSLIGTDRDLSPKQEAA